MCVRFAHARRYWIAGVLLAVCVMLGINGSSVGMWCQWLGGSDDGLLLGVSRAIRSDEWAVFTPLAFSQSFSGFGYFGDIARASPTDMFLEYGQAVWNPLVVFRPFEIGYLILPPDNGLSFFWCGRLIALLLAAYEFGRLLTNDRRGLSAVFALAVAFSPLVQWWFSVNGLVEMLVACCVATVVFDRYLAETSFVSRLLCLAVLTLCAGMYILTVYPAWQVPLGYLLFSLLIWRTVERRREIRLTPKDWTAVAVAGLVLLSAVGYFLWMSREAIGVLSDTVYPGRRFVAGGGLWKNCFFPLANVWSAWKGDGLWANACESASFLDFFPLVWILSAVGMIRRRNVDFLSVSLLAVAVFLISYCMFGFPDAVAKLLQMGRSYPHRTVVIASFCNLILLIRTLALATEPFCGPSVAAVSAVAFAFVPMWICRRVNPGYLTFGWWDLTALVFSAMNYCLLRWTRIGRFVCMSTMIFVTLFAGGLVNPVRIGTRDVREIRVVKSLREIVMTNPKAKWMVTGGYQVPNVSLFAGARCINTTNIYPDLARWRKLDPEGRYENEYNRYAHIDIRLKPVGDACFVSPFPDLLRVEMTVADLRRLDVEFVMSSDDLEWAVQAGDLRRISTVGNFAFYEVTGGR